jgi:hypothetical protein
MIEAVHAYRQFGPEVGLVLAILRQFVIDASNPTPRPGLILKGSAPRIIDQMSAIETLLHEYTMVGWGCLLGVNGDYLRAGLCRQADLTLS